jgi:hypothetical protein
LQKLNEEINRLDVDEEVNYTSIGVGGVGATNVMSTAAGDLDDGNATAMCNFGDLSDNYRHIHGYLSLVVCIVGIIFNLLNIAVLTRKEMNGSPINRILTGMM